MRGCGRDVGAFRTCGTEGILCLECAPPSKSQPIYTIPARDVVPGLMDGAGHIRYTDIAKRADVFVWEAVGVREISQDVGAGAWRPDEMVEVTLPGPSPRELCCTCAGAWATAAREMKMLAARPPHEHETDCPVAPVQGVHGGMRLWPAPAGPIQGWGCRHGVYNWTSRRGGFGPWAIGSEMIVESRGGDGILDDTLLAAFYHPPAPPIEKPKACCWDPYPGALLDLAGRWG